MTLHCEGDMLFEVKPTFFREPLIQVLQDSANCLVMHSLIRGFLYGLALCLYNVLQTWAWALQANDCAVSPKFIKLTGGFCDV